MRLSIVITHFNEPDTLRTTIDSVRENTSDFELIVVDDGSTVPDWEDAASGADIIVRHDQRIGIAPSRLDGVARASGDVLAFLDAHMWVSEGCLNLCADLALERQAIVYPCVHGPVFTHWRGHGCRLGHQQNGLWVGSWKSRPVPRDRISRCTMMIVPGYCIPRANVWPKVRWIAGQREWGAGEPTLCVQAFFADVDILHLCGPLARHLFRRKWYDEKGHKHVDRPFHSPFKATWRNHAILNRVTFEQETWEKYWIPKVFSKWHRGDDWSEFDAPTILDRHAEFQQYKKRPDEEIWRGLMGIPPYPEFTRQS